MNCIFKLIKYSLIVLIFPSIIAAQGVGKGTRFDLTSKLNLTSGQFAQLFIPDYYVKPADDSIMLVFHFHSASWAAEDQVYKSRVNAVLFNIHLGGLSSPYQNYFTTQTNFQKILDTCLSVIKTNGVIPNPKIKYLILSSFSAGYAGVREIFKNTSYYNKINALTLADGLHSNSDPGTMATQMKDFLQFAKDARDKKKIMILTHSSIPTSGYESTTKTADYLISGIGASRVNFSAFDEIGNQTSKCDTGYFRLKGYTGQTADDHMKHLYAMNKMLEQVIAILNISTTDVADEISTQKSFILYQNFPNPFNGETSIKYSVLSRERITLRIYDVLGREIAALVDEVKEAGSYNVTWKIENGKFTSGIFFYQLRSGSFVEMKKMILLK